MLFTVISLFHIISTLTILVTTEKHKTQKEKKKLHVSRIKWPSEWSTCRREFTSFFGFAVFYYFSTYFESHQKIANSTIKVFYQRCLFYMYNKYLERRKDDKLNLVTFPGQHDGQTSPHSTACGFLLKTKFSFTVSTLKMNFS